MKDIRNTTERLYHDKDQICAYVHTCTHTYIYIKPTWGTGDTGWLDTGWETKKKKKRREKRQKRDKEKVSFCLDPKYCNFPVSNVAEIVVIIIADL